MSRPCSVLQCLALIAVLGTFGCGEGEVTVGEGSDDTNSPTNNTTNEADHGDVGNDQPGDKSELVGLYEIDHWTHNEDGCDAEGDDVDDDRSHLEILFCDPADNCEDPEDEFTEHFCEGFEDDSVREQLEAELGEDAYEPNLMAVPCSAGDDDGFGACEDQRCDGAIDGITFTGGDDTDGWEGEMFGGGHLDPDGEQCQDPEYNHHTLGGDGDSVHVERNIHFGDDYPPQDGFCTTDQGVEAADAPCAEYEVIEATRID